MHSIEEQAELYAEYILNSDVDTLVLYPLGTSSNSTQNRFRLALFKELLGSLPPPHLKRCSDQLDWLQRQILDMGYTIEEVDPDEWEVDRHLQQGGF